MSQIAYFWKVAGINGRELKKSQKVPLHDLQLLGNFQQLLTLAIFCFNLKLYSGYEEKLRKNSI